MGDSIIYVVIKLLRDKDKRLELEAISVSQFMHPFILIAKMAA